MAFPPTDRRLTGAVAALAVALALAMFRRRPVKRPEPEGTWAPVHR